MIDIVRAGLLFVSLVVKHTPRMAELFGLSLPELDKKYSPKRGHDREQEREKVVEHTIQLACKTNVVQVPRCALFTKGTHKDRVGFFTANKLSLFGKILFDIILHARE